MKVHIIHLIAYPAIIAFVLLSGRREAAPAPAPEPISAVQLLRAQRGALSDWQHLVLAIALTESRFDPDATGPAGDTGILQLLPVYVDEVNRVAGTGYTIEDAFSPDAALEMFEIIQGHYNPGRDIDAAIYHHNKRPGYRAAVLRNLEFVERYEQFREVINKSQCHD